MVAVEWEEIDRTARRIEVTFSRAEILDRPRLRALERAETVRGDFRVRELLGHRVIVNGVDFRMTRDVIFDAEGDLKAIVVRPLKKPDSPRPIVERAYVQLWGGSPYATPYAIVTLRDLLPWEYPSEAVYRHQVTAHPIEPSDVGQRG
jgi:hypothetical protein